MEAVAEKPRKTSSKESTAENTKWSETQKNIYLSECIEILGKGLDADEKGNSKIAFSQYTKVLEMLMTLIKEESSEARRNMFKTKFEEVMERAERTKAALKSHSESVAEAMDSVVQSPLISEKIEAEKESEEASTTECDTILSVEGVNCFSILGQERQLISSGTLELLRTKDSTQLHILKLGEFEFPLTKAIPCLRSARGYYMVPMPGGIFYGFVFPQTIPDQYLHIFENKLEEVCTLRTQELPTVVPIQMPSDSTQIAKTASAEIIVERPKDFAVTAMEKVTIGVEVGAKYAVQGIVVGARIVGDGVEKSGQYLKSKLVPNETPSTVNPKVASAIFVASKMTPICVTMSKALIKGLVKVAEEVGVAVADSLHSTDKGKELGSKFNGPRTEAAKQLGKTAIVAIADVWTNLDKAGRTLMKQTSATTVEVVEHKFGKEAAKTTEEGLKVATDTVEVALNVRQLGVKQLAKKVAKETAKSSAVRYFGPKGDEEVKQLEHQEQLLLQD
eukprot:TRINITY_DN4356_c0_g1_i1.p1 TRINITY_DN4356_c0_g1~~TRINITY_DN4356_c0_g1_i1.p1  ORF type:complete len:505 (+),score=113.21 TRINITY_DN4356_c0_g1_i1:113-1627(+)